MVEVDFNLPGVALEVVGGWWDLMPEDLDVALEDAAPVDVEGLGVVETDLDDLETAGVVFEMVTVDLDMTVAE